MTLDGGAVVASAAAPAAGGARRLTVKPSMLGYTRGISCRIASSRWRTMTYSRRKVADPKKSSVTRRHERCRTAKPSTRSKMPATSAAFHTTMTRVAASTKDEPITATMKSAHDA